MLDTLIFVCHNDSYADTVVNQNLKIRKRSRYAQDQTRVKAQAEAASNVPSSETNVNLNKRPCWDVLP